MALFLFMWGPLFSVVCAACACSLHQRGWNQVKKVRQRKVSFKGAGERMAGMIGAALTGAEMVVVGRGLICITRPPYQTGRGKDGGGGGVGPIWYPKSAQDKQAGRQIETPTGRQTDRVPHTQPVLRLPFVCLFRPCDHLSISLSSTLDHAVPPLREETWICL